MPQYKPGDPDRYNHDVDWAVITALKKIGVRLIRDNSIERGPLKSISNRRIEADDVFKFNQTTSHQKNMKDALKSKKLPAETDEYPTDTLRHWKKHSEKEKYLNMLKENGWVMPDGTIFPINYKINKQGFRHDGANVDYLSEEGGVIYIGDSHTMGVGMPLEETWTYQAHYDNQHTKDLRYINMGCPGYGIDSYYRLLKRYIKFLKPQLVVLSYPWHATRTEAWSPKLETWEVLSLNKMARTRLEKDDVMVMEYFHTASAYLRWYKNVDAIKWLCHSNGSELYAVEDDQEDQLLADLSDKFVHRAHNEDYARDLVHSGRATHKHNALCLNDVFDYIGPFS